MKVRPVSETQKNSRRKKHEKKDRMRFVIVCAGIGAYTDSICGRGCLYDYRDGKGRR
jgi:hypothetical protein